MVKTVFPLHGMLGLVPGQETKIPEALWQPAPPGKPYVPTLLEFPGGSVVMTMSFHCRGQGVCSVPGQGTCCSVARIFF